MQEILEHMVKSEGFQEAVNLLYEIQKAQTDVHEQTNKERQERIKRILEGGGDKPAECEAGRSQARCSQTGHAESLVQFPDKAAIIRLKDRGGMDSRSSAYQGEFRCDGPAWRSPF